MIRIYFRGRINFANMAMACVAKENFPDKIFYGEFIFLMNAATECEGISNASEALLQ
jgi:hypothetical protein